MVIPFYAAVAIELIAIGPEAGSKAFAKIVAGNPDNINARRGLVLSAMLGTRSQTYVDPARVGSFVQSRGIAASSRSRLTRRIPAVNIER